MAEIKAFRGIRYNKEKVNLQDVVTQPYDKITTERQEAYYKRSPYNIVRIILNRDKDPYTSANEHLTKWLEQGILIPEQEPCIYPYFQEYTTSQGETRIRKGFCALLRLEDFSTGVVLPHERTLSGPKEDRLKLLVATKANFGQIFMLYSDPEHSIIDLIQKETEASPLLDVSESYEPEVKHKLWKINNPSVINQIIELMSPKTLLIADGHHRYETALNYSKENPSALYRMITFVSMEDPGLLILPTHRAIYGIEKQDFMEKVSSFFTVNQQENKDSLVASLEGKKHTYGLYDGKFWQIKLKDKKFIDDVEKGRTFEYRNLDVTVLHSLILEQVLNISKDAIARKENIDYLRDMDDGIKGVDSGKYDLFFILNPTRMEEVREISAKHEVMPQKSTDFYPKLISGLVMNKL